MKKIAVAIIKVMQAVKGMEKRSRVGSGKNAYNGTKDQDVKEVFNEALAANGLCVLPTGIEEETEIERWVEDTQWGLKQKQSVFTKVKTKYLLLHESGESIELAGYGHGVDPQDKGAGKATTYALKNCLLYAFLTPVGKIDDTETVHSDQLEVAPQQPKKAAPKKKAAAPKKAAKKTIPAEKMDGLKAYAKKEGKTTADIMKQYDLTVEQEADLNAFLEAVKN
jgi:hypothetical protein